MSAHIQVDRNKQVSSINIIESKAVACDLSADGTNLACAAPAPNNHEEPPPVVASVISAKQEKPPGGRSLQSYVSIAAPKPLPVIESLNNATKPAPSEDAHAPLKHGVLNVEDSALSPSCKKILQEHGITDSSKLTLCEKKALEKQNAGTTQIDGSNGIPSGSGGGGVGSGRQGGRSDGVMRSIAGGVGGRSSRECCPSARPFPLDHSKRNRQFELLRTRYASNYLFTNHIRVISTTPNSQSFLGGCSGRKHQWYTDGKNVIRQRLAEASSKSPEPVECGRPRTPRVGVPRIISPNAEVYVAPRIERLHGGTSVDESFRPGSAVCSSFLSPHQLGYHNQPRRPTSSLGAAEYFSGLDYCGSGGYCYATMPGSGAYSSDGSGRASPTYGDETVRQSPLLR